MHLYVFQIHPNSMLHKQDMAQNALMDLKPDKYHGIFHNLYIYLH